MYFVKFYVTTIRGHSTWVSLILSNANIIMKTYKLEVALSTRLWSRELVWWIMFLKNVKQADCGHVKSTFNFPCDDGK